MPTGMCLSFVLILSGICELGENVLRLNHLIIFITWKSLISGFAFRNETIFWKTALWENHLNRPPLLGRWKKMGEQGILILRGSSCS